MTDLEPQAIAYKPPNFCALIIYQIQKITCVTASNSFFYFYLFIFTDAMTTEHDNQSENTEKNNCQATSGGQQGQIKSTYCCPSKLSRPRKYTESNDSNK